MGGMVHRDGSGPASGVPGWRVVSRRPQAAPSAAAAATLAEMAGQPIAR